MPALSQGYILSGILHVTAKQNGNVLDEKSENSEKNKKSKKVFDNYKNVRYTKRVFK